MDQSTSRDEAVAECRRQYSQVFEQFPQICEDWNFLLDQRDEHQARIRELEEREQILASGCFKLLDLIAEERAERLTNLHRCEN